MYLPLPYKILYDINKFPFRKIIENILNVSELENLHNLQNYDILNRENDQSTVWHRKYYDNFETKFLPTYIKFIQHIKEQFGYSEIIYQRIPTFRVHLGLGNIAVGEWHKDKTYNHGITEVNFWMPFTDTNDLNTVWIESKEDRADYMPYNVRYGEILVFNGANLKHGNKNNHTDYTRVSVDFRLVEVDKFISNDSPSINTKVKFDLGGYFEKL